MKKIALIGALLLLSGLANAYSVPSNSQKVNLFSDEKIIVNNFFLPKKWESENNFTLPEVFYNVPEGYQLVNNFYFGRGRGHGSHGNGNGWGHENHGNGNGYGHGEVPTIPIPAAVWLFGSAISLLGFKKIVA